MNYRAIATGALSGFLSALLIDVNAWSRSQSAFDWGLAAKRWIAGAATGALAALGVNPQ